jgi:ATP-dependent DNA helicase RecQ
VAGFDRPNIFLEVRRRERAVDQLVDLAESYPEGSGIVYCFSRSRAEAMAADLSARGVSALPYHAGLADETRSANQDAFIRDEVRVICATTAFGMGIDKPDVRFVAHADLPKSVEQYYQEIGRAGRDGLPARALLLYGYGDIVKIRALVAGSGGADRDGSPITEAQAEAAEASLRAMQRYAESSSCRRACLLAHFGDAKDDAGRGAKGGAAGGDAGSDGCGSCDVCAPVEGAPARERTDVTDQALKFLSCVARTGERYGAGHVVDVLLGSKNERVLGLGHSKLSTWGIGKEWPRSRWMELARLLAADGYLDKDEEYGVLRLTGKAREAFRERPSVSADMPAIAVPAKASRERAPAAKRREGPADPAAAELERELRALRRRLADESKLPPYVVFSDRTLYELIEKAPSDRASLLGVFGMGAVKVGKYGEAILEILGRFRSAG